MMKQCNNVIFNVASFSKDMQHLLYATIRFGNSALSQKITVTELIESQAIETSVLNFSSERTNLFQRCLNELTRAIDVNVIETQIHFFVVL